MTWQSFKIWIFMAFRFILRHKRKTISTGSFIILGTAVLVFLHGLTVGINDTMVINSTRLHYGDAFLAFPPAYDQPEAYAKKIARKHMCRKSSFATSSPLWSPAGPIRPRCLLRGSSGC